MGTNLTRLRVLYTWTNWS